MVVDFSVDKAVDCDIRFVSYIGEYPNLCQGILLLLINDKIVTFGDGCMFPAFWESGGENIYDDEGHCTYTYKGSWLIDKSALPRKYRKYVHTIDKIFNDNVPKGCCGGCADF